MIGIVMLFFDVGNLCFFEVLVVVGFEIINMRLSKIVGNNFFLEVGMLKKDKNIKFVIFFYVIGFNEFRV